MVGNYSRLAEIDAQQILSSCSVGATSEGLSKVLMTSMLSRTPAGVGNWPG